MSDTTIDVKLNDLIYFHRDVKHGKVVLPAGARARVTALWDDWVGFVWFDLAVNAAYEGKIKLDEVAGVRGDSGAAFPD